MVAWKALFNGAHTRDRIFRDLHEQSRRLLPYTCDEIMPALPSKEVTKVALRLKYQVERVIPCEVDRSAITDPNSNVITKQVIQTAKEAGGEEYRASVLFCLLVCVRWFKVQAHVEPWNSSLHECRALACEVLAKLIIESEPDRDFLFIEALLKRYSIFRDGQESSPVNVIERAVDIHALRVISTSGYQKCVKYLWRGWFSQDDEDPSRFVEYRNRINSDYWVHFDPGRVRSPVYQNALLILFTLVYLVLYTVVINTVNVSGDLDVVEAILYIMTLAYTFDELTKIWKVGKHFLGFANVVNLTLYSLLGISFVLRVVALAQSSNPDHKQRRKFGELSYNFLAFAAPMFWIRLLLFFDSFPFVGSMLVVLKVMMQESIIFFALLFFILAGFLQAFVGMGETHSEAPVIGTILQGMASTLMSSPDFGAFQNFSPPFGIILYYLFNFVVMVLLLNILIALYNTSYQTISDNADNEYLAHFSQKTLQFIRAPDENVFVPPFNLIGVFLAIPFEWWMPSHHYRRLSHYAMGIIYSPFLFIIAWIERREARQIRWNRLHGQEDDLIRQEWEQLAADVDFDPAGWDRKVDETKPNIEVSDYMLEIQELKEEVRSLTAMVRMLTEKAQNEVRNGVMNGEHSNS